MGILEDEEVDDHMHDPLEPLEGPVHHDQVLLSERRKVLEEDLLEVLFVENKQVQVGNCPTREQPARVLVNFELAERGARIVNADRHSVVLVPSHHHVALLHEVHILRRVVLVVNVLTCGYFYLPGF